MANRSRLSSTLKLLVIISIIPSYLFSQEITDTIYFNKRWQICEKPIAAYYRIGMLVIDSFWYYKGNIKDYTVEGQLVMEGNYSKDGYKNGLFNFYYPNGNLKVSGNYNLGRPAGAWRWNYPNDSLKAVIMFRGDEQEFGFLDYREENGQIKMQYGTGDFEWVTGSKTTNLSGYKVKGSFKDGLRYGTWKYLGFDRNDEESLMFSEKYDREGHFKKVADISSNSWRNTNSSYNDYCFSPWQISVTEHMAYDDCFRKTGDSLADMALIQFLVNGRSPEIVMKDKKFENAMLNVMHYLEGNSTKLEYQIKEIDGKIEFRIGDNAYPEDITVSGAGISDKEKEFLIFIMNKFHNIDMPGTESMAMEGFHTINFFSINMKEFMPERLKDQVNNELFFTTISKEKFLALLKADKRKIKRYIRGAYSYYW